MSTVRIGCSSGFWGDSPFAAAQLVLRNAQEDNKLDFLVNDYLAEVTLCLLARQKQKGQASFIKEFCDTVWKPLLRPLLAAGTKVVTNAGGLDPVGLARLLGESAALAHAEEPLPVGKLPVISAVWGDDIHDRTSSLRSAGGFQPFVVGDTTEALWEEGDSKSILTANAYLGARPIARALDAGAQVVVTGRVVDSAIVLGPLLHVFGWSEDDWDLLSAGSLAGHLIECGCHATGGNYTDWRESNAAGWQDVGYPIAEVSKDGSFVITKTDGTGGVVNCKTLTEQLLYEIHDPSEYILPDVICDWMNVHLEQVGPDRVRVTGAQGWPAPSSYKCAITQSIGYKIGVMLILAGREAPAKLRAVAQALIARVENLMAMRGIEPSVFDDVQVDVIGSEVASFGENARPIAASGAREAVLRMVVAHPNPKALMLFARETVPVALAMAPGIMGGGEGRPGPLPRIRYYSCLLDKSDVPIMITMSKPNSSGNGYDESQIGYGVETVPGAAALVRAQSATPRDFVQKPGEQDRELAYVPLIALCYGRSGDKGDVCNIGIAVRDPEHYDWIRTQLTADSVRSYMHHHLDSEGTVTRYELPGVYGLNFVLTRALGSGGISSLRMDRQGKAYAQVLLEMRIPVPVEWIPAELRYEAVPVVRSML